VRISLPNVATEALGPNSDQQHPNYAIEQAQTKIYTNGMEKKNGTTAAPKNALQVWGGST
jgi:hypothetical protein